MTQVWGLLGAGVGIAIGTAHWIGVLAGLALGGGALAWASRRTVAASPATTEELSAQGYLPFGVGLSIAAVVLAYTRRLRSGAGDLRGNRDRGSAYDAARPLAGALRRAALVACRGEARQERQARGDDELARLVDSLRAPVERQPGSASRRRPARRCGAASRCGTT